ncbi:hypothetical protein TRICI_006165 [Trichomonascus ciferrii]|uniref:HTH TFE/IIEalpha-type domain-containing protein n=1 Tax=Trichomonascus ciferrii TaxID=44093 RepID=A0A642UK17_9ASCO|nr:hypothetical protein TRICI_006165 [Trichomonascus ciferrii]
METVKKLIQYVTRGFCDLRSVLVIDALLVHSALTDDDLAQLLGIQRKDLRAVCAKLKEDHLLTDHVQKEEGPGQRPISKTYYYIHFTETIDAIKWKMHSIVNRLKEQMGNDAQPQGYVCDTCKTRYATLDAVTNFSPDMNGFLCDLCGNLLREDDNSAQSQANQERLGDLMTQIQPIIDALKQIDDVVVPENTFQSSLAHAIPPPQASQPGALPSAKNGMAPSTNNLPTAKARPGENANGTGSSLTVNITSDQEKAEMEQKQKEEKARLAEENALPTWHVESTVGKSLNDKTADEQRQVKKEQDEAKAQTQEQQQAVEDTSAEDKANEEALAAYYATLAKQEAEEDEDEEDEEEEDDEEAEFEDVNIEGENNNTNTVEVEEAEFDEDDD